MSEPGTEDGNFQNETVYSRRRVLWHNRHTSQRKADLILNLWRRKVWLTLDLESSPSFEINLNPKCLLIKFITKSSDGEREARGKYRKRSSDDLLSKKLLNSILNLLD